MKEGEYFKKETKEQKLNRLEEELKSLREEIKEENTFRKGDVVTITRTWIEDNTPKGFTTKVTSVNEEYIQIIDKNGENFNVLGSSKPLMIRKATPQEIEEYNNRNKLPSIGCREGEETERHIKYGDKNLSKKCLRQMERVGIVYIGIEHNGEKFDVSPKELNKIYETAKR